MYVVIDAVRHELVKGSGIVNQRLEERSTASFTVIDKLGSLSFERGQTVSLYNASDELIFGGVIDTPRKVAVSPSGGLYHDLQCMDWHYASDKRLVIASYTATNAGTIATALHTDYLDGEGVTIGEIQAGPELVEVVFNYISVSEAFDALAELTGYTWFIDEQKRLFFIDRATYSAPWDWSTSTPKPQGSMASLSEGNPMYRNRQWVRGGTGLTTLRTEDRLGDGSNQAFTMDYPLGTTPTVTEDGGPFLDIGIRGIDTGKDYYWNKGDRTVTAEVAPGAGVVVQVKYQGQYPLISMASDEGQRIARQAIEGGSGYVDNIIDEGYHESGASSQASSSAKLLIYARDAAKYNYQTTRSGLKPGQIQTVNYPLLGLNDAEMLIESVTMTSRGEALEIYDVTAIVGPVTGSWAKFFSTLLRRQTAMLRVGDSQLLVLLQESEDLDLVEVTSYWNQAKGEYCWAPKTNGGAMREGVWDFFTWG